MPSRLSDPLSWSFDIDRLLNRFIPPPPWKHIPYPIAYMLGYRKNKPRPIGNIITVCWTFLGIFCAISTIIAASEHIPAFTERGAPIIVGSFGAGAVLEFYAIESPLAQPRNFFFGQILAAIIGVGICKLFMLSDDFESIRWAAAAVSCATVTSVMALTKTVHPPAGATAVLAVVDAGLRHIGWFFVPVVMLNCGIMFTVALLVNNIQRVFPLYWWTPEDLRRPKPSEKGGAADEENLQHQPSRRHNLRTDDDGGSEQTRLEHDRNEVVIQRGKLLLPNHLFLMPEEIQYLEEIGNRL
ncbi:HPP family-domain-containing protein [Mariannaea sp. PMI_226]|nr:HPP family-domain-containing protein [Mariannaea sp. PMI_226]